MTGQIYQSVSRRRGFMRMMAKTDSVEDGCIIYRGSRTRNGYPWIRCGAELMYGHHLVWILKRGRIQPGLDIAHRCHNPACLNISHMYLTDVDDVEGIS